MRRPTKPMSGATDALAKLTKACAGVALLERAYEHMQTITDRMAFGNPDLVERMHDVALLILTAEELEQHANMLVATARAGLATVMSETNCPNLKLPYHTVVTANKSPSVIVTDPTLIPSQFLITPEPRPNLNAIRQFLAQGERIPGAELSNAGEPILSIRRSRK